MISREKWNVSNRLFLSAQFFSFFMMLLQANQPLNGIKTALYIINYVVNFLYADAKAD